MHHRSRLLRIVTAAAVAAAAFVAPALVSGPAQATTPTYDGPDVASYQHPSTSKYPHGKPINWAAVKAAGKEFAIVKATEGTTYKNPFFDGPTAADYPDALAAGLVHGSYHFARPALPVVDNAKQQAAYFAKAVGPVNTASTLPPALDLEVTGGLTQAQLVTWAQVFLYRLRSLTGRTPMLYTYPYFWSTDLGDSSAFSRFPLWMASYGTSTAPVADLWQYTDAATINGISGKVDVSKFVGTSGLPWATLSNGTIAAPWKVAAPSAPRQVTVAAGPASATLSWLPGSDGSARTTSYIVTATPVTSSGTPTTTPTPSPDVTTTATTTATPTPTSSPTSTPSNPPPDPSLPHVRVTGAVTSATITGLDSSKFYSFSVVGVNSVGYGKASALTSPVQPIVASALTTAAPTAIHYGKRLMVTAKLTRSSNGALLANQRVRLFRREVGKTTWADRGVIKTGSAGVASLTLHPKHSVQLKFKFPGINGYLPSTATTTTLVRPVVTAVASATTLHHGHTVRLTGTVTPVVANQQLTLQVLGANGAWKSERSKPVRSNGKYTFTVRPPHKQAARRFRVIAAALAHRAIGISPTIVLHVT